MKELNPKVSIVIPVYNGSNFLSEAIDSALVQTYKNIEVIVVNDGSDDGGATEKVAKSYGDKIRYYKKENCGVASALNFGIKRMKGNYFSWLSHDDLYEKTKIEEQINLVNQFKSEDTIVACSARVLFPNGINKKEPIDKRTFKYFDIFLATSALVGINGCSLLIPRKALVASNGFNENLPVTQDYDLWFRLKDRYKFVLLEKPLVISRRHEMQDSVLRHDLMVEAGDKLHFGFLTNIAFERFEKYFSDDKANIKHTWRNYKIYKTRGYSQTALMILKNILRYYYKNDTKQFYKFFNLEVRPIDESKTTSKLEFDKLFNASTEDYLIKKFSMAQENPQSTTRIRKLARRLRESLRQDGVYLTGEKIVRKVYAKVTSKRR